MGSEKITRRFFITKVSKCVLYASLVAPFAAKTVLSKSKSLPIKEDLITLDLTKPEYEKLNQVGEAIKIPYPDNKDKPIIVYRTSDKKVIALSSKCTHLGCELPVPVDNVITCPCHKSTFDENGKVTKGPANADLPSFNTMLSGSVLTIKKL